MPYRRRPPIRSAFSNTVTAWPARFSCWAAASPDGPEPTTAILLPVRVSGSSGLIHPSSQARSTIVFSINLIRNDVGDGAAGVAKRNAAIHAACGLHAHFLFREWLVDLEIVVNAFLDGTARRHLAGVFLKPRHFTHRAPARVPAPASWLARSTHPWEFAECPEHA